VEGFLAQALKLPVSFGGQRSIPLSDGRLSDFNRRNGPIRQRACKAVVFRYRWCVKAAAAKLGRSNRRGRASHPCGFKYISVGTACLCRLPAPRATIALCKNCCAAGLKWALTYVKQQVRRRPYRRWSCCFRKIGNGIAASQSIRRDGWSA
jgi:hypothetical protein